MVVEVGVVVLIERSDNYSSYFAFIKQIKKERKSMRKRFSLALCAVLLGTLLSFPTVTKASGIPLVDEDLVELQEQYATEEPEEETENGYTIDYEGLKEEIEDAVEPEVVKETEEQVEQLAEPAVSFYGLKRESFLKASAPDPEKVLITNETKLKPITESTVDGKKVDFMIGNYTLKTYSAVNYQGWVSPDPTQSHEWNLENGKYGYNSDDVRNIGGESPSKEEKAIKEAAKKALGKSVTNSSSVTVGSGVSIKKAYLVWVTRSSNTVSQKIALVNSDNKASIITPTFMGCDYRSPGTADRNSFYTSYADVTSNVKKPGKYTVCNLPVWYINSDGSASSTKDKEMFGGGTNVSFWSLVIVANDTSDNPRPRIIEIDVGCNYLLNAASTEAKDFPMTQRFAPFKTSADKKTDITVIAGNIISNSGGGGTTVNVKFKESKTDYYNPTTLTLQGSTNSIGSVSGEISTDKSKDSQEAKFTMHAENTSYWDSVFMLATQIDLDRTEVSGSQKMQSIKHDTATVTGRFTNTAKTKDTGFKNGVLTVELDDALTATGTPVLTRYQYSNETKKLEKKTYEGTRNGNIVAWSGLSSTTVVADTSSDKRTYFEYSIDCTVDLSDNVTLFNNKAKIRGVRWVNGNKPYGDVDVDLADAQSEGHPAYRLTIVNKNTKTSVNGGTFTAGKFSKDLKVDTTVSLSATGAAGYYFDYWEPSLAKLFDEDEWAVSGASYMGCENVIGTMPARDVTITVVGAPNRAILIYNANGGTGKGWNTADAATRTTYYTVNGSKISYTAKTKENKSGNKILDKNTKGEIQLKSRVETDDVIAGSTVNPRDVVNLFKRENYHIDSADPWIVGSPTSGVTIGQGTVSTDPLAPWITSDGAVITLYANWKPDTITVNYNYGENGGYQRGTGLASTSASVTIGSAIPLPANGEKNGDTGIYSATNPDGWQFVGWSADATCPFSTAGTGYYPANTAATKAMDGMTLYAVYKKSVSATFVSHKYTGADPYAVLGANGIQYDTKRGDVYNKGTTVTLTAPNASSIAGWDARGWVDSATVANSYGTGVYSPPSTLLAQGGAITIGSDAAYYADYYRTLKWYFVQQKEVVERGSTIYRNSYNVDAYTKNASASMITQIPKTGWNAIGWTRGADAQSAVEAVAGGVLVVTDGDVFYGRYSKDITISYDSNGYDPVDAMPSAQVVTAQYTTAGWDKDYETSYPNAMRSSVVSNGYLTRWFSGNGRAKKVWTGNDRGYYYPTVKTANLVSVYRKINERKTDVVPIYWSTKTEGSTVDTTPSTEWVDSYNVRINCYAGNDYEFREDTKLYQQYKTVVLDEGQQLHHSVSILVGDKVGVSNYFNTSLLSDTGRVYVTEDRNVARVTQSGFITGVSDGQIVVNVYASDGKSKIGDCTVTVSSCSVTVPERVKVGEYATVGVTARAGGAASVTASLRMEALSGLKGRKTNEVYGLEAYTRATSDAKYSRVEEGGVVATATANPANKGKATSVTQFKVDTKVALESLLPDEYDAIVIWDLDLHLN